MAKVAKALKTLNKKNRSRMLLNNLGLSAIAAAILSACGGGGSCGNCVVPSGNSQLIFVAPSILPSLANKTGVNYMGVYNPSSVAISGISYSVGQQVGSGNSITLDQSSAAKCANIPAQSSCFLKFSVPESTIAGGTVVTASNSDGSEAATPLAMGVQQVAYTESANANGVGLYFYPKAQYSESGVPFILVTAVVQSPNVGNVNTIELVDESGNVIPDQVVTSNNAGPGSSPLQMGDVVEIALPIPQGVNLTQNIKVQTSYQTLASAAVSSIAERLNLKNQALKATTNSTTSTATYTLTTQGNNINLQLTPNQVYLTQKNSIQYGYLYNIGDLTASQITVSSSSPNVKITVADAILNGQRVIKVTYELINTSIAPTTNTVLVTGTNPSGQTQTSTGGTSQNVNPDVVPTPTPSPTPTPTPGPTPPGPPPPPPLPQLTVAANPAAPVAGGACSSISATVPSAVSSPVTVTFTITPVLANSYGFGSGPGGAPFSETASCIISSGTTCSTGDGGNLCAATGTGGTAITVTASAAGYQDDNTPVTIASPPATSCGAGNCRIFATSVSTDGDLVSAAVSAGGTNITTGFEAANYLCQNDTNNPVSGSTYWKAMLQGNSATNNGTVYYRPDQTTQIGTGNGDNLRVPIDNFVAPSVSFVWTGGYGANYNCNNWTSGSGSVSGTTGWGNTDQYWTSNAPLCTQSAYLYCVEQFHN